MEVAGKAGGRRWRQVAVDVHTRRAGTGHGPARWEQDPREILRGAGASLLLAKASESR